MIIVAGLIFFGLPICSQMKSALKTMTHRPEQIATHMKTMTTAWASRQSHQGDGKNQQHDRGCISVRLELTGQYRCLQGHWEILSPYWSGSVYLEP